MKVKDNFLKFHITDIHLGKSVNKFIKIVMIKQLKYIILI